MMWAFGVSATHRTSSLLEYALRQLLEHVWFDDHFTPDLIEMSGKKGLLSRIQNGL